MILENNFVFVDVSMGVKWVIVCNFWILYVVFGDWIIYYGESLDVIYFIVCGFFEVK